MNLQNMKETLLARTITVIASEGLDKTTTKAIVTGTGINEAYIYRNFSDKEDLLAKAFEEVDREIVDKAMEHISAMYTRDMGYEARCRYFFFSMWEYFLDNKEKSLTFIRYYYSPYFKKYSAEAHRQRYECLVSNFEHSFAPDIDAKILLNYIFNIMLNFAVKVFDGELPNDDNTSMQIFGLIYNSMRVYFKEVERC